MIDSIAATVSRKNSWKNANGVAYSIVKNLYVGLLILCDCSRRQSLPGHAFFCQFPQVTFVSISKFFNLLTNFRSI